MPFLSIILPRKYNSTLEESYILPSIEGQIADFNDIEIILCSSVVEGQTPCELDLSSLPKVNKVAKQYSEKCFMSSPGNSRNIGLKHATGKYVVFWDYDDYLFNEKCISTLIEHLRDLPETVSIFECSYYVDFGTHLTKIPLAFYQDDGSAISFFESVWNYAYKLSFIKDEGVKFQETIWSYEDSHFSWDMFNKTGFKYRYYKQCDFPFYVHRDTIANSDAQYALQTYHPNFITDLFRTVQEYVLINGMFPTSLAHTYLINFQKFHRTRNVLSHPYIYQSERKDMKYYFKHIDPQRTLFATAPKISIESFFYYSIILDTNVNIERALYLLNAQLHVDYDNIEILIPKCDIDISKFTHLQDSIFYTEETSPAEIKLLSNKVIYIKSERDIDSATFIEKAINKFNNLDSDCLPINDNGSSFICVPSFLPQLSDFISSAQNSEKMISFVIPYHNEEPEVYSSLFNSINSQINLNFKNIEILICRGDNDERVPDVSAFDNIKSQTKFIIEEGVNGSPGYNRSLGLKYAQGKYVAFLDIDDELASNDILSNLISEIEQANYPDVIDMPFVQVDFNNTTSWVDNTNPFQLWASVYKTSFIRDHQIDFAPRYYGEDLTFVIEVDACRPIRYYYNKYFYKYKLRNNSAITQRVAKYALFVDDTSSIYEDLKVWKLKNPAFNYFCDVRFINNIYPLLGRELNSEYFKRVSPDIQIKCIDTLSEMIRKFKPYILISNDVSPEIVEAENNIELFLQEVKI